MPQESVSFEIFFNYDKSDYPNYTEDELAALAHRAISQNTDLNVGEVRASKSERPPWSKGKGRGPPDDRGNAGGNGRGNDK